MNAKRLAFLCALAAVGGAGAQTAVVPVASAPEVILLRAQVEAMRMFHDSFLSMAQWALGTAIAVVLSLAVFSWFTSKANYERDRELLQQQVKILKEEIAALVALRTSEARTQLEALLSEKQSSIQKAVEVAIQSKLEAIRKKANAASDCALEVKGQIEFDEGKRAHTERKFGYAIYKYGLALETYVQRETADFQAAEALDAINDILKEPGLTVDADQVTNIVDILKRLPPQMHIVADALISGLRRALGTPKA